MKGLVATLVLIAVFIGLFFVFNAYIYPETQDDEAVSVPALDAVPVIPDGWIATSTDVVSFAYPETLNGIYVRPVVWPPAVTLSSEPFLCNETEIGTSTSYAGITAIHDVKGNIYCVTQISEGAAGSVYNQYAYVTLNKPYTAVVMISVQEPRCENYDSPKREACIHEQTSLNIDELVNAVIETIILK